MAKTAAVLRIGTALEDQRWAGVVRQGRKVVLTCGCGHHNRDITTKTQGLSARDCITSLVKAAWYPEHAALVHAGILRGPESYLRTWQASRTQAERLRQAAAAFTARLPGVAALIGDQPVYGYLDHIAVAPPLPGGVRCRHCGTAITPQRYTAGRGWSDWRAANVDPCCPARAVPARITYCHEPPETLT